MTMFRRRLARGERGSAAVEFVLILPLVLAMLLFVVGLGRMAQARINIEGVAADAARAASLERNTARSAHAAREAAERSLGDGGVSCSQLTVSVDVSAYQPGGRVTATVSCTARLADVALSGLPGNRKFSSTAVVPIETYRGS